MSPENPDTPAAGGPSHCPRCGAAFHCGAGGSQPCPCGSVTLGAELQARLRAQYTGCLCLTCLRELAAAEGTPTP